MILNDDDWIDSHVDAITDEKITISVSSWAEENRYLPPQVTPMPGFYSYDVAPYLKEIADCFSMDSPVREFDLKKGAQIGATVGVFENAIGYFIDHVKTAPVMLLTADAELAKLRMESNITPMIQHSGLEHKIRSVDETNTRKTGKTDKKLEWEGGGYLVPFGAKNADKLRSVSMLALLEDECDTYPESVGKDGDPQKLTEARTTAYHERRKIGRISTPLLKGSSRIDRGFLKGDQRRYHVPCKNCKKLQVLKFRHEDKETGQVWGLVWDIDEQGGVIPESVRYICQHCGHPHENSDKSWMLPRGKWIATAKAKKVGHRSYHLNALLSPIGMLPWSAIAEAWIDAWDDAEDRVKDPELLQVFYNNMLGEPFSRAGSKIRFSAVSGHRRDCYRLGEIPNKYAERVAGSPVLLLTCQIDVHKSNLAVTVMGWCRNHRTFVVSYERFEDEDCTLLESPVWARVRELVEETEFVADDGRRYKIAVTLIDAGYANATVSEFCAEYATGVYPILGRDRPAKNQTIREFASFETQAGTIGFRILVDHYKDMMAPVLRREWEEAKGPQPKRHFNAPIDIPDKALKELTVEELKERKDITTGRSSHYWHRPSGAPNELWDLLGYGHAAIDILAWSIFCEEGNRDAVDWEEFWDMLEKDARYFEPPE